MPTYEYFCKKCNKNFEVFQKISEKPLDKCPKCKEKVKKLVSAASFALKGSGWYKDGYSKTKTETSKKTKQNK